METLVMIKPENNTEIKVCNKAITSYRWQINRIRTEQEFLKDKKFQLSDIVVKYGTNQLDAAFGVGAGNIGKIVGYDFDNNYYRVYYSKQNPYIGVEEEKLEKWCGKVPDDVLTHDPFEIDMMLLRL